jgi:hypothetical protein
MKILTQANSSNDQYDADISFVLIDLTPKLARLILKRCAEFKRLKAKDKEALETYYWCGEAIYLRYDDVAAKDQEAVNVDLIVETKSKLTFEDGQRVECSQMFVDEDSVTFTAIPKHTSIYITSERIPLSTVREAAKRKK